MRFDRRRLFGLFGAAAVAPVVAQLPVPVPAPRLGRTIRVWMDVNAIRDRHNLIVDPPMVLGQTDTGVFFRGIPVHVVDELKDGRV